MTQLTFKEYHDLISQVEQEVIQECLNEGAVMDTAVKAGEFVGKTVAAFMKRFKKRPDAAQMAAIKKAEFEARRKRAQKQSQVMAKKDNDDDLSPEDLAAKVFGADREANKLDAAKARFQAAQGR